MASPAYDLVADWYDQLVRSGTLAGDIVLPRLFALLGDVHDRDICGQGRLARVFEQRGARVVGVDLSQELIAIAHGNG